MNVFNRNMIIYKSAEQIGIMREAAQVVSRTLGKIAERINEATFLVIEMS